MQSMRRRHKIITRLATLIIIVIVLAGIVLVYYAAKAYMEWRHEKLEKDEAQTEQEGAAKAIRELEPGGEAEETPVEEAQAQVGLGTDKACGRA